MLDGHYCLTTVDEIQLSHKQTTGVDRSSKEQRNRPVVLLGADLAVSVPPLRSSIALSPPGRNQDLVSEALLDCL